ncbi:hypothetical protein F4703DRAFT_1830878 [Phycomyces blakesleeanus]
MEPNDHYTQAAAMTTFMPLPQETAIPARKRNNSLIPPELMNDASEGGRERAALATVFGVREYTQSKMLWERQAPESSGLSANLRRDESSAGPEESRKSRRISILDPFLALASQAEESREISDIPVVSRFNDFLIEDENGIELMFPANPSSVLLIHQWKGIQQSLISSRQTMMIELLFGVLILLPFRLQWQPLTKNHP